MAAMESPERMVMTEEIKKLEARLAEANRLGDETTQKVDILNALADIFVFDDAKRSLEFCVEAYELSKKLSYPHGMGQSLGLMGVSHFMVSDHDAAYARLLEAMPFAEAAGDETGQADILSGLAGVQLSLGDYERALSYSFKALNLYQRLGNPYREAWCLNGIGGGYHELGDFERAMEYHNKSLEIFNGLAESGGGKRVGVGKARALNGIGTVCQSMGDFENARRYHQESLELFKEAGNRMGEARALNDLGNIFVALGEFDVACKYHKDALKIREDIGNKQAMSTSLISLGNLYVQQRSTGDALDALHKALDIATEIKAKPRIYQANLALSDAYKLGGDFENALAHYKIYQEVKEEVSGDQANARVKNLQVAFEVEKSEREAEIARLRNVELKETNAQLEQLIKELGETQAELVQSKKMAALGVLVAGLVHEINSPLGVIISAADVTSRAASNVAEILETHTAEVSSLDNEKLRRSLTALEDNNGMTAEGIERIKRILASLRSFAKLDEAPFQKVDLNKELDTTLEILEYDLEDRIEIVKEYGDIPEIECYPGELNQVFLNLMNNAVESITGSGSITIRSARVGDRVRIDFVDTGVGIPAEQLPGLFDPIFSAKGQRVKAGMGLFTCYNIVRRHNGDIEVESTPGEGSNFTVILPLEPARTNDGPPAS